MNNSNNNSITEKLAIFSDVLQVVNTYLNTKQTSNDIILKKLEEQDDMILKHIINQLNNINEKLNQIECILKDKKK